MQLKGLVKNTGKTTGSFQKWRQKTFERDIFNHEKIQNQKFDQDLKNLVQDQLLVRKQNRHFHQKNDWYHHHKGENENQIKMIVILKVMKKKMKIHQNRKNKR